MPLCLFKYSLFPQHLKFLVHGYYEFFNLYIILFFGAILNSIVFKIWDFRGGSVVKNPHANAGDVGSVPGWGQSPGGLKSMDHKRTGHNLVTKQLQQCKILFPLVHY